jgi:hypothetical protein
VTGEAEVRIAFSLKNPIRIDLFEPDNSRRVATELPHGDESI